MRDLLYSVIIAAAIATPPAMAKTPPIPQLADYSYADVADLVGRASVVADVQVRRAKRLRGEAAAGVPAGRARFLIEGQVLALIRGAEGLPARVTWLADVPLGAANRPPRLRKTRLLLLAVPVPGKPAQLRLIGPDAQLLWTPELDARLRKVLTAMTAADAPPRITGIGNAFHVPGSLPGESETQIFLTTDDGRPVSLAILRRPGETPRWAVALGEMVDEAAAPPPRDSLLWYRLACFLPEALPATATTSLDLAAAAAAREDYRLVMNGLGECARTHRGQGQASPAASDDAISTPTPAQSG